MKNSPWYTVAFMFAVTAFFSSILIALAAVTRERVATNERSAFERAVMEALDIMPATRASPTEMHKAFAETVQKPDDSSGGAFMLVADRRLKAYALPFSGQGFWAPVSGVLGISADTKRITGISFYEQNETPGLGAEIAKTPFRRQFRNLPLPPPGQVLHIRRAGATLAKGEVHGVTGATQTSVRVERIINNALANWRSALSSHESRQSGSHP